MRRRSGAIRTSEAFDVQRHVFDSIFAAHVKDLEGKSKETVRDDMVTLAKLVTSMDPTHARYVADPEVSTHMADLLAIFDYRNQSAERVKAAYEVAKVVGRDTRRIDLASECQAIPRFFGSSVP